MTSPFLDIRRDDLQAFPFVRILNIALGEFQFADGVQIIRVPECLRGDVRAWNKVTLLQVLGIEQDFAVNIHEDHSHYIRFWRNKIADEFAELEIAGVKIRIIAIADRFYREARKWNRTVLDIIFKFPVLQVNQQEGIKEQNYCDEESKNQCVANFKALPANSDHRGRTFFSRMNTTACPLYFGFATAIILQRR